MKTLVHPYTGLHRGAWTKGNLHTHTTRSDGARSPQDVIDDYASRGHGFLMLSDHDTPISEAELAKLHNRGMVLIPGNEVSDQGPHLLHVNASCRVPPHADRQRVIDEVIAAGGLAIVNHPNWYGSFDHCSIQQMTAWSGYVGLEIYNGTIGRLDGSPYATNKWDMLLAQGRQLWGFANDDSHTAKDDVGLGWNVAYIKERTVVGVVNALAAGRFYASTGVTIKHIEVTGMHIRLETEDACRIVALQQVARRFAQVDDKVIDVTVPAGAQYVRFECWGAGEKFAWTQPFFVAEEV
ncbi:MAG TPA: CehA/McbA family metallohydrolase [Planctomycetota bacterium]|jgi:hypothetical protein